MYFESFLFIMTRQLHALKYVVVTVPIMKTWYIYCLIKSIFECKKGFVIHSSWSSPHTNVAACSPFLVYACCLRKNFPLPLLPQFCNTLLLTKPLLDYNTVFAHITEAETLSVCVSCLKGFVFISPPGHTIFWHAF